ncbi:alpha-galactosidase [bacterium]|nr:alpha-galactosidase [bacterium]
MLRPAATAGTFVLDAEGAPGFEITVRTTPAVPFDAQATPAAGGVCELIVRPTAEASLEELAVELSPTGAGTTCLQPEARVLSLGGFELGWRGAVALGTLLDEGEGRASLTGLGVALQGARLALVLGAGHANGDFPAFSTDGQRLTLTFTPQRPLAAGERFRVLMGLADDVAAVLADYGAALGRDARPLGEAPTGWNSWDYYRGGITMDACAAEMAAINASPLRGKLRYFVIDMGWENCWGDWRPNRKFPEDPADIAGAIKAAGFAPGIWVAPLQASTYVPWVRDERDCFCQGADGDAIVGQGNGACVLFDPTHPRTVQWLHDTFSGLREAGFELFKVDYLYRAYFDSMATLHDPTVGKAAAARRFLEIIREAIGPDAHLLSCGAPLPCALGLADSARISADIHNFWGHVRHSAIQIAGTHWLNGRAWVNDPDFALIRCAQTSADRYQNPPYTRRPYNDPNDFWLAGDDATWTELHTWLSLVHLCGGSIFASDSIARLNERGLAALAHLLSHPAPAPAVPLDLVDAVPPRLWLATAGEQSCLGVFNWEDEAAEVELPANAPTAATDYWTGEKVSLGRSVRLEGRSALVVEF